MSILSMIVGTLGWVGVVWYAIKGFKVNNKNGFKNLGIGVAIMLIVSLIIGIIAAAIGVEL